MNTKLSPAQRADMLLAAMTIDDEIALTAGRASQYGFAAQTPANDRLCIPQLVYSDGPAGIAGGFGGTQVGVTPFPVGIAQAASFDPALQRRFGVAAAEEALAKGANVLLGPAMNINRVPTNGRNFEYFGEDPFLAARAAVAVTRGVQSKPVVATAKHYAANNQETDRMSVSAEVDERTLREIYLPAFEAAVREGRAGSVMCAYNKVNGKYACENPDLLTSKLKDDWGFSGWVMSDWLATHSTEGSANAGLDQEQNGAGPNYYGEALKSAVESGKVSRPRLDDMARRIVVTALRIGLFDHKPAPQPGAYGANASTAEHQRLALDMAEQGGVLLKNAGGALPLDGLAPGSRIAVIGRSASPAGALSAAVGVGSAHVNGVSVDPLRAISERASAQQAIVSYAEGDPIADAVAAASAADVAIVFARDATGEGSDRPGLALNDGFCALIFCAQSPADQDELIAQVAAANPRTIVVALTSGPITMPWLADVKGVLEMWYPGMQYGTAVAALLFGDANPSGKLPQTFPKRAEDLPASTPERYPGKHGKALYSEGLDVGYRWFDAHGIEPLFPFGFGLSYTTFAIGGLRIADGDGSPDLARVTFDVTNTGSRAGAEVGQVYVGFPEESGEPPKRLEGFRKVWLEPGETRTVTIGLGRRAFSRWDTGAHGWVVDRGCYSVMVGRSSRAIDGAGTIGIGDSCGTAALRVKGVCRRSLNVRLRKPRGERPRLVVVRVNGRVVRTLRGRALRLALRQRRVRVRLPAGRSAKRIEVIARGKHRSVRTTRRVRGC